MDESNFEATVVIEMMAEIGKVDAFFEAIDSDNFEKVRKLMSFAGIDSETIQMVIKKMSEADSNF